MPSSKEQREAIFESASIPRAVLVLSLPTVLSSLVSVVYNMADTFFVGMLNDPVQTAAVSLSGPVLLAFNAVNNLFGVGGSSMMSRAYGGKDFETLRRSSAISFYGSMIGAAMFALLCMVFRSPLLNLIGADASTAAATNSYLDWTVTWGAVPTILNVVIAYLIRSEGAAFQACAGTISGCVLNILLDPFFILPWGLNMGAEGAAIATCLSNYCVTVYFMTYLFTHKKTTLVCISPKEFRYDRHVIGGIFAVGIPATIQNLLNVAGGTMLNNLAAPYGPAALAAMGISSRVHSVPQQVAMGLAQGIMPLISYNYASRNVKRMKEAFFFVVRFSVTSLVFISLFMSFHPEPFIRFFIDDPETVAYGTRFLRGLALALPFLNMDFIAINVFQAVGMGRGSLMFAILRKVATEIPLMFILNAIVPLYGLAYAQVMAEFVMATAAVLVLRWFFKKTELESAAMQKKQNT